MRCLLALCAFAAAFGKAVVKQKKGADEWKSQMLFSERLIAGAGARGVAQTMLHPIDVMRTRLQAKGLTMSLDAKTFVKGVAPQFLLAFPAGACQFAAFEFAKEKFAAAGMKGALAELSCGAIGALAASVVRVPQEVIKQRVQADIYPNALAGTIKLMTTEGIPGFYKGYFATISRDVPWNALSFMFFAQAKKAYTHFTGSAPEGQQNLLLGALSGMTAAVIMTPIDVIKTRIMTGGEEVVVQQKRSEEEEYRRRSSHSSYSSCRSGSSSSSSRSSGGGGGSNSSSSSSSSGAVRVGVVEKLQL